MNFINKLLIQALFLLASFCTSAAEIPVLAKMAVVNPQKVFDSIGKSDVARINKYLVDISVANQIQVTF
ncbi:hypothetical protein G6717_05455 [Polynucleobacter paneuropaeus]|nr:hypothetical protein [Polynucleobacter paneuropaeus]